MVTKMNESRVAYLLNEIEKEKVNLEDTQERIRELEVELSNFYREHGLWRAVMKYPPDNVVTETDFQDACNRLTRVLSKHASPDKIRYIDSLELVEFMINGSVYGYVKFDGIKP
jgi:hypothetical protein